METNTISLSSAEIEHQLRYYSGTEKYYRFTPFYPHILLTDGTKEAQRLLGCNWLFLHIASRQYHYKIKNCQMLQQIQFWTFTVDHENQDNLLVCERDKGDIAYKLKFDCTDFKLEKFKVYVQPMQVGEHHCKVIHLPNEY